jgi:hypothetical protein
MSLADMLVYPTMLSFNMSKYVGSNTMIFLLQCLLHGGACPVSLNILLPNVASGADLSPKCWSGVRCWGNHGTGSIIDDEAQVSQCASAQVSVDCPQVCLKKFSGGVDCLLIRLALNYW